LNSISLEQELAAVLTTEHADSFLKEQLYDYKSVFLNRVFPDTTNPRFFPAIIMSDKHAYQTTTKQLSKRQLVNIYNAEDKVLIGKSCIVNCCKYGSNEWKKANKSIESIIELGENVAVSEIIQVPTIYPTIDGNYQILTGHRRFFALIYANGIDGAAHFKVYKSKPVLQKTKQFQENASREDLPQYGKLRAFQDAMQEIEVLNTARKRIGQKALTVKEKANTLGISMGAFDNYNVLTRYPAVIEAYENGDSTSFVKMKKKVLSIEKGLIGSQNQTDISNRKKINSELKKGLAQEAEGGATGKASVQLQVNSDNAKTTGNVNEYEFKGISSEEVLKKILTTDLTKLDSGIDWSAVDWNDILVVNDILEKIVSYVSSDLTRETKLDS